MKKIALIMDGWKRFFTFAWPSGILERIHETNEDVNLYIFSSSGNWRSDRNYNVGEYNIYNLPDLTDFDGIILEVNNVSLDDVLKDVIDRAGNAGVPVLSIANEIDGFYYVGIDNRKIMYNMIEHLHREHECEKFWFVMGPEDNYESRSRIIGLKNYMNEKGIEYSEEDFCYCKFDYKSGYEGVTKLFDKNDDIPDAIICVNDNIAVAVCEAAKERGYRVPEDICVTGFDDFDKAAYYDPSISTVKHIREEAGYLCADILLKLWKGEEVLWRNYTPSKLILQESCGCSSRRKKDLRKYLKQQIMYGIDSEAFEENVLNLESSLMECNTIEEMMYCIPNCIPALKCDAMYLVLDKHIDAYKASAEGINNFTNKIDDGFCVNGYPESMRIFFAYENGEKLNLESDEIKGLFPTFDSEEGGKDFLFIPIHFDKYTVGYLAIKNAIYLMDQQYLFQTINTLISAMENLHTKEKLEYMNRKLSSLYMIDPLTNMYNRMGHQQLGETFFNILHAKDKQVHILFIDLDRLKYINDNFGHEYGDFAICAVARAIMKNIDADAVPARTGGDEFIVIQTYKGEEEAKRQIENIRASLSEEEKNMQLKFELSISVGSVATVPKSEISLNEYIKQADNRMYEEKLAKKANRQ